MVCALSTYRAVLLDVDDTIYDYKSAHALAIRHVYYSQDILHGDLDCDGFIKRYRAHRARVTDEHRGTGAARSRFLAFLTLFEELQVSLAYDLAARAEDMYWDHLIKVMEPMQDLVAQLRLYHAQGGKICVVTDMQARVQIEKLRHLKLLNNVDFLVTSEEIGSEKPDPRLFTAALEKLNVEASDALMIGDSYEKDIMGAQNLGIHTWHVSNGVVLTES